ncbi:MAG: peptidoglycan editing factor PgeF [Firmicutes bacterium]|nr:peptidoglycan editing factor PgeF [Bacillota bacterium]
MQWEKEGDYWIWRRHPAIQAIFTTKAGGVSSAPFDSMNISFNVQDDQKHVRENRYRVAQAMGCVLEDLAFAQQVHANRVAWVDARQKGAGADHLESAVPDVDGILTMQSGLVLSMGFADCVPIFLTDASAGFVGLLHAGWRGTASAIVVQALKMINAAGIVSAEIYAGIGPSIGPCCYEVDKKVAEAVTSAVHTKEVLQPSRPDHFFLDLWQANRRLLEQSGVPSDHIDVASLCTACRHDEFFSYRYDQGQTGRMGAFICR